MARRTRWTSIRRRRCCTCLSDDLALRGPKFGCGLGQCGACTVIVKGQAIRSCITPVKLGRGIGDHHARRHRHHRQAPSPSARVHRRAGRAMRLLHQRRHHDRQSLPGQESEGQRRADSSRPCRACCAAASRTCECCGHQSRAAGNGVMKKRSQANETSSLTPNALAALERAGFSRRGFLKGAGALVVGFSMRGMMGTAAAQGFRGRERRFAGAQPARFLDRHRRRRRRDRLHRQRRTGPGNFDRANPVGRGRAVRAVPSRQADLLRHGDDARSGSHFRQPVASHQFQSHVIWPRPAPPRARRWCSWPRNVWAFPRISLSLPMARSARRAILRRKSATANSSEGRNSNSSSTRTPSASRRASGPCSARRRSVPIFRPWSPDNLSLCTTCACPACCTAGWCGRRPSARPSSAWTKTPCKACPAS